MFFHFLDRLLATTFKHSYVDLFKSKSRKGMKGIRKTNSFQKKKNHVLKKSVKMSNMSQLSMLSFIKKTGIKDAFGCGICGLKYKHPQNLRRHCLIHHKQVRLNEDIVKICGVCRQEFRHLQKLQKHISQNHKDHPEFPYICGVCSSNAFRDVIEFQNHITSHEFDFPSVKKKSKIAKITVNEKIHVKKTMKNAVTNESISKIATPSKRRCSTCGETFTNPNDLTRHALKHIKNRIGYKGKLTPEKDPINGGSTKSESGSSNRKWLNSVSGLPGSSRSSAKDEQIYQGDNYTSDEESYTNGMQIDDAAPSFTRVEEWSDISHSNFIDDDTNCVDYYKCPLCPASKPKKGLWLFNSHIKNRHKYVESFPDIEGTIKCPSCITFFNKPKGLLLHLIRVHSMSSQEARDVALVCETTACQLVNNGEGSLTTNEITSSKIGDENGDSSFEELEKKFKCILCGKIYGAKCSLLRHSQRKHGVTTDQFNKEYADGLFESKLQKKTNVFKRPMCLVCKRLFPSEYSVFRHAHKFHPKKIALFNFQSLKNCENCRFMYREEEEIIAHRSICRGKLKKLIEQRENIKKESVGNEENATEIKFAMEFKKRGRPRKIKRQEIQLKAIQKPRKYPCVHCNKVFSMPILLAGHTKSNHMKAKGLEKQLPNKSLEKLPTSKDTQVE